MTNHVVLFEPRIAENTGNIARSCAGTDTILHLIEPFGFVLDDKDVKRSSSGNLSNVNLVTHLDLADFLSTLKPEDELYLISKFAAKTYSDIDYTDTKKDYYFMFGREDHGLPETYMRDNAEKALRIPMSEKLRSFNLANSVAIVLFEALRQQGFPHLETSHLYDHDKLK